MRPRLPIIGGVLLAMCMTVLCEANSLVPQDVAARSGMVRSWYLQTGSLQAQGPIVHLAYDEDMILAQSSRGMLTAIDGETGRLRWSTQVGPSNRLCTEPAANADYVVVVNGSTLYVLDRHTGRIQWEARLRGTPGAGPGVTKTHAFIPMSNGKIEGYSLAAGGSQHPWSYKSVGKILVPPMTAGNTVSWTTERGYFYVANEDASGIRYRLETRGSIPSKPTSWWPTAYAASNDGYLYSVNQEKGSINWKFAIGDAIFESPVAMEDRVFVVSEHSGLYCLDPAAGKVRWVAPAISHFVSASPTRVYVGDRLGRLAILDGKSGVRLSAIPLPGNSIKLANNRSDRVYLAGDDCIVQCLREASLSSPVLYVPPEPVTEEETEEPKEKKPPTIKKPADEDAPEEAMSDEGDAMSEDEKPAADDADAAGDALFDEEK